MSFENLSDREKKVLYNLIKHYIQTADPVGSRTIANKFAMGVSPATIRNTLQDLEEMGLVQQPHTSAGRIPTDLGYRVYVDYLLQPEQLTPDERKLIRDSILREGRGLNEILGQTCRVLGEITNQLGVSIAPRFESGVLRRIDLIPVSEERIMVVVVVESGLARSLILEIEASIDDAELREFERVLNERIAGFTLGEVKENLSRRLADVSGHGRLIKLVIDSKDKIWSETSGGDIHIAGTDRLLQHPEFATMQRMSDLIKLLENGKVLSDFLKTKGEEGIVITIGRENKIDEILNCSLVTSSYRVGNISGSVGIIGPTRMPYSKLVSIVECTARTITDALSGLKSTEKSD